MGYTVNEILELRKQESKAHSDWRVEAREDFEFRDSQQWSQDDEALLEEQGRPKVTFNRIGPIIASIKGMELNNRQEIRYLPRTREDSGINEVYSAAAKWIRDECHAEDEESDLFDDAATTGLAWGEWYVDFNEDPEGKICFSRIPPLEMRWDHSSRRKNLADRRWDMREKWLDKDVILEKWPKAKLEISGDHEIKDWMEPHDATQAWKYESNALDVWTNEKKNKYLVLHFQWKEKEDYYRVANVMSGETADVSASKWRKLNESGMYTGAKLSRWKYREMFLIGDEVLEERDIPTNYWTRVPLTASREESTGLWYGIVRAMKDPQRWANKFFSQAMHIFNSNPKGGVMMEEDAVDDKMDFENKWADPSGVVYVKEGALLAGKVTPKPMTGYPSGLDNLLQFAISSIRDVSGMNVEMLGMADRQQSGILEQERKKAALIILAPLQAAMRQHRKESGKILLGFMRKYLKEGRMMRLVEQGQTQYVPFMKDDKVVQYDVIVDTAPTSPNVKIEVWQSLQNMLPALLKAGVPIPPAILDFSPLPESVIAEWKKYIESRSGPDPQETQKQMQQMQQQIQKLTEQNKQLSDKREEVQANMQLKQMESQQEIAIQKEKMLLEARNKEMELQLKRQISEEELKMKMAEIQAKYDIEIKKIREESAAEEEKRTNEMNVKLAEAHYDMETKRAVARIAAGADPVESKEFATLKDIISEINSANKELLGKITDRIEDVEERLTKKIESDNDIRQKILKEIEEL